MLSENQINSLLEFSRKNIGLKVGEAWCYDAKNKILYSPVRENKLIKLFQTLPSYKEYKVISGKSIRQVPI